MKEVKVIISMKEERAANICPHCGYTFIVDAFALGEDEDTGEPSQVWFADQCVEYCPACGKQSERRDE